MKYFLSVSIHLKCVCILRKPKSTLFANTVKGDKNLFSGCTMKLKSCPFACLRFLNKAAWNSNKYVLFWAGNKPKHFNLKISQMRS